MQFGLSFYRAGAVCSILSSLTTLLLIFLPELYAPVEGFDGRMSRVHDPMYVLRSWTYLIHPFLVLTAALGVAMRIRRRNSTAALVGMLGFLLWAFTEAAQQTMTLFAFDAWRVAYPTADETLREHIRSSVLLYDGLWNAMYVLLLLGFAAGNLAFGLAMSKAKGLTRTVGYFFLAAFVLTLTILLPELGGPALPERVGTWLYAAIQPLGRALIGVWLWLYAVDERG
jgi:hypothetical protein